MTLVSAAVFVYYPASITANWVNPPVVFSSQGLSPQVNAKLYDDNTRAEVDVTSPGVLTLARRNAFIYDDFSTNPFSGPNPRLTVLGSCSPGALWDQNNQYVVFDATGGGSGGWNLDHMTAYYSNLTPTGASRVYLLMRTRRLSNDYGLWKGFFLFRYTDPSLFREYYVYMFWDSPNSGISRIYRDGFQRLATLQLGDSGDGWYVQWGVRYRSSGYMEYRIYDYNTGGEVGRISATNTSYPDTPIIVGFGGALNRYEIIAFDDFVATSDADPTYGTYADPSFVTVIGLMQGWTVYLRDSGNNIVAIATAGPDGVARLNVLTRPIVRNARFEIRWNGIVILPSQSFSVVVGGDVYSCNIRDMNILGFRNRDNKAYSVYLKLEGIQVPYGYSGSINLWLGTGFGSTPIRIVGNAIYQGMTSPITLGPGMDYIHGTFSLSPQIPVNLTLSFHYYLDGVEVEYPIMVRVHS